MVETNINAKTLGILLLIGLVPGVQMMSRSSNNLLLPITQRYFCVNDTQIGHLQGTLDGLIASLLALPCAIMVDRYGSRHVFKIVVLLWMLGHVLCGLSSSFSQFSLCKILIAATEFSMVPIIYTMTPQYVAPEKRFTANIALGAAISLGYGAGYYFGSPIVTLARLFPWAEGDAVWRGVMEVYAVIGVFLYLICQALPQPHLPVMLGRHGKYPHKMSQWDDASRRGLVLLAGLAGFNALATQGAVSMMTLAFSRRFGLDIASLGHYLGMMAWGVAMLGFPFAAALDFSSRRRWGRKFRFEIMLVCITLAIPCTIWLGFTSNAYLGVALMGAFLFLSGVANIPIPTMIQELTPPFLHARIFALWSLFISGFGAFGAVMIGVVSDRFVSGATLMSISMISTTALTAAFMFGSCHLCCNNNNIVRS